jgi:cytochrome c oxidase cbb3-type subunit I
VFYITAMWVAGIMQGLMWRAYDTFGFLQYSFAESVVAVHPYYVIRLIGGLMFLTGALIMVYNLILTVYSPVTERERVLQSPVLGPAIAVAE